MECWPWLTAILHILSPGAEAKLLSGVHEDTVPTHELEPHTLFYP